LQFELDRLRLKLLGLGLELGRLILELCMLLLQLDLLALERAIGLMQRLVKPRILDSCRRPSPHIMGVEEVVGGEPNAALVHLAQNGLDPGIGQIGFQSTAIGIRPASHHRRFACHAKTHRMSARMQTAYST